ncbi:MAG: hypothetical protein COX77_02800 [Candidatus Komeilibacteria bacterium CG_4_10_14_0_2_um_filter_37_10]|uniref:Uncharacterized protein n=1 Tax=Candidatus Komeilibacteria bacterium CG_4_10_14_0_2_um_filter_37_10 TaxID=1974470 RepID=A0A2M7VER6_9BACT|nr:MAG: hypothetical protein COX77_02800 [Candidatus Komeilibacteria bacterium CG_4_10_14_0_2_um_filter_37_10]
MQQNHSSVQKKMWQSIYLYSLIFYLFVIFSCFSLIFYSIEYFQKNQITFLSVVGGFSGVVGLCCLLFFFIRELLVGKKG